MLLGSSVLPVRRATPASVIVPMSINERPLLDVDARVVAPDELARRVREVLADTETDAVELAGPRAALLQSEDRLAATTRRVPGPTS